jgi:hypothetical protein
MDDVGLLSPLLSRRLVAGSNGTASRALTAPLVGGAFGLIMATVIWGGAPRRRPAALTLRQVRCDASAGQGACGVDGFGVPNRRRAGSPSRAYAPWESGGGLVWAPSVGWPVDPPHHRVHRLPEFRRLAIRRGRGDGCDTQAANWELSRPTEVEASNRESSWQLDLRQSDGDVSLKLCERCLAPSARVRELGQAHVGASRKLLPRTPVAVRIAVAGVTRPRDRPLDLV